MTVKLDYNPFSGILKLKINGKELESEHRLLYYQGKRIQYYLNTHKLDNWQGLIIELQQYLKTEVFTLVFQGRDLDFYDVQLSCQNFPTINLVFEEKYQETDILQEIEQQFSKLQKQIASHELEQQFAQCKNSIFDIAVVATMSSGKSTFINSMLGKELLPSKNAACTATITSILDTDDQSDFEVECFDEKGQQIIQKQQATVNKLEMYNDDANISLIKLYGDIRGIYSEKMKIQIFDTPGPNNAQDVSHGEITKKFIADSDHGVIVYLMDATSFGTDDDKELLECISDAMKEDKQQSDRFLFVLNKCDALDHEKGETLDKLVENARTYLATFGIHHANIFPVTAELAKVARMDQNEIKLTLAQKRTLQTIEEVLDYEELQFEKIATLSPSVRQELDRLKNQALQEVERGNEEAECDLAIIYSGIKGVELTIQEYLDKYAFPIQMKKMMDLLEMHRSKIITDDHLSEKAGADTKSSIFKVGVVATMSSGKSTFINSMLGQDLLPAKKAGCTSTITSILDTNDEKLFEVECFDEKGQQVTEKQLATARNLEAYNNDSDIARIKLYGDILSLSSERMDIEIYEIPGPNKIRATDYHKTVQAFIDDKNQGVIIYLMDAISFGKNDDKWLLERIADVMKEDNQQNNRFLFVLNKCDALDYEKGETIDKLVENARAYLSTFGIHHANIFPVTAELAKAVRMDQNELKLTLAQKRTLRTIADVLEYEELQFDRFATLSPSVHQELENLKIQLMQAIENENYEALYDLALIYSGIKGVELTIQEYLDNTVEVKKGEYLLENENLNDAIEKVMLKKEQLFKQVVSEMNTIFSLYSEIKYVTQTTAQTLNEQLFDKLIVIQKKFASDLEVNTIYRKMYSFPTEYLADTPRINFSKHLEIVRELILIDLQEIVRKSDIG